MVIIGAAIIFAFGVLYLSQLNSIVAKGSDVDKLEAKRQELQDERDRLQVEATRLQSLQEIEKTAEPKKESLNTKFVPVKSVNYVSTPSVALR
jgi:cell division protein FtsL